MNVGIVGHEAAKFTPENEVRAKKIIRTLLREPGNVLVSGHCPLGGIDIWAEEIADELHCGKIIHAPDVNQWDGGDRIGFKQRNLAIARDSHICHCIVVRELPPQFGGRRFPSCYHCLDQRPPHVKSGGCWTALRAPIGRWWFL